MSDVHDLDEREWDVVARILAREVRRLKRRHERSDFVPEPGHVDMALVKIRSTEEILVKARANRDRVRRETHADDR